MSIDKVIFALVGFVVGALVGALLGLLFAPMSGRELQYRVRKESQLQAHKARAEWQSATNDLSKQVAGLRDQISSSLSRG